MRTHLSEEMLIDALDGAASATARAHVRACESCAGRLRALQETLEVASGTGVPEPSPFFWAVLRKQVGRRIGRGEGLAWRLAWKPGFAATAAVLVAALGLLSDQRQPAVAPEGAVAAWSALPPLSEDGSAPALEGAFASLSDEVSLPASSDLTTSLAALTEDERRTLSEAVHRELGGNKS